MHLQPFSHTSELPMCRTGKSLSLPTSGDIKKVRKIAALSLQPPQGTLRDYSRLLYILIYTLFFVHSLLTCTKHIWLIPYKNIAMPVCRKYINEVLLLLVIKCNLVHCAFGHMINPCDSRPVTVEQMYFSPYTDQA